MVSVGTEPNFFGVPGAAEHAFPLYSALDAENLRNRMLRLFEDADLEPGRLDQGALNFVIVGGGATGVETAGALADLIHEVMPERYHDLDISAATITLVDHGDVVLAPFSDKAHVYAAKALDEEGRRPEARRIGHRRRSRPCGVRRRHPHPVPLRRLGRRVKAREISGLEALPNVRGRISVGPDLGVEGYPGLYAVGDGAAGVDPDGEPVSPARFGRPPGRRRGRREHPRRRSTASPPAFKYHDKGIMAMIGHGAAVAEMGKHHHELHGSIAFAAWLGVHAWLLNTTRARIDAFINWAWDAFSNNRGPAIIDDPDAARIDWARHRRRRRAIRRRHPNPSQQHQQGQHLMIENARTKVFWLMVVLTIVFVVLTVVHSIWWLIGVAIAGVLSLVGIWDLLQTKHSLLRNYPIVGHARFLLEDAGPGTAPVPRRGRHRRPPVQP